MYTSGWVGVGILRAGFAGGAERLPCVEVLVGSGVAVLLRGTVDPGLLGTVTPGGWIGCRGPFRFKLAREAPDALRCIALVIMDVAWLASALRIMFCTSFVESGPPGPGAAAPPLPCCRFWKLTGNTCPFGAMNAEFIVTRTTSPFGPTVSRT